MRYDNNYIYYDKEDTEITIDDITIEKPKYFNKANKNFRLNTETNSIEKYCKKCDPWSEVLLLDIDTNSFIVDSTNFHYYSDKSGFMPSCRTCASLTESTFSEKSISTTTKGLGITRPLNINIPKNLKKYLNDVAFENDESITNLTIRILEEYKSNNPINS